VQILVGDRTVLQQDGNNERVFANVFNILTTLMR
jgi:hypothetical protein